MRLQCHHLRQLLAPLEGRMVRRIQRRCQVTVSEQLSAKIRPHSLHVRSLAGMRTAVLFSGAPADVCAYPWPSQMQVSNGVEARGGGKQMTLGQSSVLQTSSMF